nr:MAG TPA: hypothetical protein [Caudoviricetes sp.]
MFVRYAYIISRIKNLVNSFLFGLRTFLLYISAQRWYSIK